MKNYLLSILILSVFFLFLTSCQKEETPAKLNNNNSEESDLLFSNQVQDFNFSPVAKQQLKDIFAFWSKNLPGADLQPVSIETPKKIESEVQRQAIIDKTLATDSYYASYDGENLSSLKVFKVNQINNSGRFTQVTRTSIDERVKVGQGYAIFKWKYKGSEFSTIYVYDENGFVYEPMVASIAIKKNNVNPAERTDWIQNFNILWVWGGKRGHVKISHSSTCSGSKLKDHSGWSNAYMTLGSAQADIIANGANSTKGCASWGYAWGTSGLNVSVSTNWGASGTYQGIKWNGEVKASVSGTLGSSGKATGFNIIGC